MHLKLKLLSGRGAVVHRMELGDRCSSYAKLRETVSALSNATGPGIWLQVRVRHHAAL